MNEVQANNRWRIVMRSLALWCVLIVAEMVHGGSPALSRLCVRFMFPKNVSTSGFYVGEFGTAVQREA
jgi:hypothetical protein